MKTQTAPPVTPMTVNLLQACAMTGYSQSTLRAAINAGTLHCVRLGCNRLGHIRLRPAELDRWLQSNQMTATANQAS